jgi:hypothetical protein
MPPQRNYGWIWYFAILAILTVTAISILIWFNLKQQLKPEQLAEAKALWKKHRPSNYDLTYTKKGSATGTFAIEVRDGKVVSVTLDGLEITRDDRPLDPSLYPRYDMSGLLDDLDQFLRLDAEPGRPRTFTVATFDPEDGHLIHYIRRVMGTSERIEITAQLKRVEEEAKKL